jgi:hypothetical protein
MRRTVDDLEAHALKYWPEVLAQREKRSSIIPRLIETQEKFIGILYVADSSPTAWRDVLAVTANMPANLFLKHLMVLSDFGGEPLQRIRRDLTARFRQAVMNYVWHEEDHKYRFSSASGRNTWTNKQLDVDGPGLAKSAELTPAMEDVAMLLLHGGSATNPDLPVDLLAKCCLGTMLGHKLELNAFVRQRYIHVSRITGGATANTMGQLAQTYVRERLQGRLPKWDMSGHTIPGISQNAGRTDTAFDIVAESPKGNFCAIEITFQVTTNSTIERKSGQAQARQAALRRGGHKIAYVVDGAGNFQRHSAVATICRYSDCTVSFRDEELDRLANFLKGLDKAD